MSLFISDRSMKSYFSGRHKSKFIN